MSNSYCNNYSMYNGAANALARTVFRFDPAHVIITKEGNIYTLIKNNKVMGTFPETMDGLIFYDEVDGYQIMKPRGHHKFIFQNFGYYGQPASYEFS